MNDLKLRYVIKKLLKDCKYPTCSLRRSHMHIAITFGRVDFFIIYIFYDCRINKF